jgi:hypothetical protein
MDRAAAISTPESKKVWIIGLSEITGPAIGYLAFEFPPGERLLTRCGNPLGNPAQFPAEL